MTARLRTALLLAGLLAPLGLFSPAGASAASRPASIGGAAIVADSTVARAMLCAQPAKAAGFSPTTAVTAVAVGLAESDCTAGATGTNGPTAGCPNGSTDRGIWQLNSCYHSEVSDSCAYDAYCNAAATYRISSSGTNWTPWSTYNSGAYRSHLPEAQAAVNQVYGRSVAGDFTGDGRADVAVWRPATGQWWVRGAAPVTYGVPGDIPVPGDYDGDGRTDLAVWRPSTGQWFVRGAAPVTYGLSGDIPVPGTYNGDRTTDIAVWRPSTGQWFFHGAAPTVAYGQSGDIPVPGNYVGDRRTEVAVWRPSTGQWAVRGAATVTYGVPGDVPVPGNYVRDYKTDVALWRPATSTWYVDDAAPIAYGRSGDIPVPADYSGDGKVDMSVWRPGTGQWFFHSGVADVTYGQSGDFPVSSVVLTRPVLHRYGLA